MPARRPRFASPHVAPVVTLIGLSFVYWSNVLVTGLVLLPGSFLRGFAPFGADPQAPWNLLQWDALGQYYPWRAFAARQLQAGLVPLWNPHQFAGAPFVANGQSAVFYPLNLPFWVMDVAFAFGVSAFLHTLLATLSTYYLAQHWQLSRAASLLAAIAYGFCGYLAAWAILPTLANTASWLPLLLLLLERAAGGERKSGRVGEWESGRVGDKEMGQPTDQRMKIEAGSTSLSLSLSPTLPVSPSPTLPLSHSPTLSFTLCFALLAGHAQIFFYLVLALALRALLLPQRLRAFGALVCSLTLALALAALQLLPTLELARLGHRAAQGGASDAGWREISRRALMEAELPSLVVPGWPLGWGSVNENFGYVGLGVCLLSLCAIISRIKLGVQRALARPPASPLPFALSPFHFCTTLALFGLLYALATPFAAVFYYGVPGVAQMGGVGRALILWSFGAALLAAYGLDALRGWIKSPVVTAVALILVIGELFASGWTLHPVAPRATIYPATRLTTWLQEHTRDGSRILFVTPRAGWQPQEDLQPARNHPPGVLPPNGAMVYSLNDINGYDSLAPLAYREFVTGGEGAGVSPLWNGNMILLENVAAPTLDALGVRYIVTTSPRAVPGGQVVLRDDDWSIYERRLTAVTRVSGHDFYPGRRAGVYQPESFRFGAFVSLCAVALVSACAVARRRFGKRAAA